MAKDRVAPGKYVSLTYRITDQDGNVLELNDLPVGYIHGGSQELIGGMEKAVLGHCAGDELEVVVPPEDGFGPHDPNLTFTDSIDNVPPEFRQVGAEVQMQNEAGDVRTFYVTRVGDGTLTVDGNHPFAGKALHVRIRILDVRDATEDDQQRISTSSVYH